MSPKITPRHEDSVVRVTTKTKMKKSESTDWWNSTSKKELSEKLLSTVSFLKEQSQQRYRQASIFARLYGNLPLMGYVGSTLSKLSTKNQLPSDRPTMSVITSCVDTLVSRLTESKPRPLFLTDSADYKQRSMAKQLNNFIMGEFYNTKAYELGPLAFRDSGVIGSGAIKILEDQDARVALERRLVTEILVDANDAFYGSPRNLYEVKLVDRASFAESFPGYRSMIDRAEQAYPDSSGDGTKTVSDQIIVAEAWRLPSGPKSGDGLHAIACSEGVIEDDEWKKKKFPFAFYHYAPGLVGFFGQGIAERQMGTQMGINQILMTIHKSLMLGAVPRVFIEEGSKVVKAHINNEIGAIIPYRGTPPIIAPPPQVLPLELYQQLERLVQFAYQQEGISELSASSEKPAGLSSGAALREYDDIQSVRFSWHEKRYRDFYVELAYQIIDKAVDIAERDGKYSTIYPNKDGTKEIVLPDFKSLRDEPYVIQAFDTSSLPRDPAGRLQKITEMMQAGLLDPQEGRRLLDYPDIEQVDKLANAAEERILKCLDLIIEEGEYNPPDPLMDLQKAATIAVQYYNLHVMAKLEPERAEMLRNFYVQAQALMQAAMPPLPQAPGAAPQAVPQAPPQSPMLPNVPGGA